MVSPFLLDTTVLLHWVRGSDQARHMDRQFQLYWQRLGVEPSPPGNGDLAGHGSGDEGGAVLVEELDTSAHAINHLVDPVNDFGGRADQPMTLTARRPSHRQAL